MRSIVTGDTALIGSLVQQRQVGVGVASDEDVRGAALERVAVEQRHTSLVQGDAGVLEAQSPHVGRAAGGGQHVVDPQRLLDAIDAVGDAHRVAVTLDANELRVGVQREFG